MQIRSISFYNKPSKKLTVAYPPPQGWISTWFFNPPVKSQELLEAVESRHSPISFNNSDFIYRYKEDSDENIYLFCLNRELDVPLAQMLFDTMREAALREKVDIAEVSLKVYNIAMLYESEKENLREARRRQFVAEREERYRLNHQTAEEVIREVTAVLDSPLFTQSTAQREASFSQGRFTFFVDPRNLWQRICDFFKALFPCLFRANENDEEAATPAFVI